MTLPPGVVAVGEKKLTRKELVGIDDTITDEIDGIIAVTTTEPAMLQVYEKATGRLLTETPVLDLIKKAPPAFLAQAIEALKQKGDSP